MSDRAQDLKAEGNALFAKGDYDAASLKYAQAIQHDDQNAILFAEAKTDAQKAVELDPTYVKGLGRLAAACSGLQEYKESAKYWKRAVDAFPKENLSAAELKQKEQCIAELQLACNKATESGSYLVLSREMDGRLPWDYAKAMEQELKAGLPDTAESSAWPMLRAARFRDRGVEAMRHSGTQSISDEGAYALDVVTDITDALLTDPRIFRIGEIVWLDVYENHQNKALERYRAWPDHSAELIKAEALERQRQEGWDAVRPAIEITVRANIMAGFLADKFSKDPQSALEHYDVVMEILQWGRRTVWKNVSTEDKGEVFEDYFVTGLRRLRLEALRFTCGEDDSQIPETQLMNLYEEAQSMIRDVPDSDLSSLFEVDDDPGFLAAFSVYPKGRALAMTGMYHQRRAQQSAERGDFEAMVKHFAEAFGGFYQAACAFHPDDEMHTWFLHIALQNMLMCGAPFDLVLRLLEDLRLSMPKMMRIWGYLQVAEGKDQMLETDLQLEPKIRKDLADGKITLDDRMTPDYLRS
ncbi:hypothetical protein DAEQUDRAFT_766973 [Daedalea quercina L-15889]|uniref:TPR-like protein n=1 Tax=Daedalea quercina L-15889 TaxID=1314783 RepID=A0A165P0G2_9APHY|nr:hypothetical protein DAEQUDRAFT_766973 [Daedalea quercina L-15889]